MEEQINQLTDKTVEDHHIWCTDMKHEYIWKEVLQKDRDNRMDSEANKWRT